MLNGDTLIAIGVAAYLQACWEDANGRRHDEEGKKPRTRRGYAKLLATRLHLIGHADHYRLAQLVHYYNTDRNPIR